MKNKKALVLLSGGLDSTVCLYWAMQRFKQVSAITFNYGQQNKIEVSRAQAIAKAAGIKQHKIINATGCLADVKTGDSSDYFSPMRNGLFLTIAASWAVYYNAEIIIIGVSQVDEASYSDCRIDFIKAAQKYINEGLGTGHKIRLKAPLALLSKQQTICTAALLNGCLNAIRQSYTCYKGGDMPCGSCIACKEREKGFLEAGINDPIINI